MLLDDYDMKILRILHKNARITMKELSQNIYLSQPACAERVKRLEAHQIIKGYSAQIDWSKVDYPLATIIRIRPLPGCLHKVEAVIKSLSNIEWCEKVTGDDAFICKMRLRHVSDLDMYLEKISQIAMTNTSVIKTTVIDNQFIHEVSIT